MLKVGLLILRRTNLARPEKREESVEVLTLEDERIWL